MQEHPESLDSAAIWTQFTHYNMHQRVIDAAEIALWRQRSADDDAGSQPYPASYPRTLNVMRGLLHPDDALLDVGAGSRRFALPLSQSSHRGMALNLSSIYRISKN